MSKRIMALLALFGALFLAYAAPASATDDTTNVAANCSPLGTWFVNPDETDRKPTLSPDGLEFNGNQLVHHAANNQTLAQLSVISVGYVSNVAPDQPSFFSVEIRDPDGAYGTLRWVKADSEWSLTTNGATTEKANPTDFIGTMTKVNGVLHEITADTSVVTFGVGYTANPPGTVDVIVSSVTFSGVTYPLASKDCPEPTTSPSSSASPSTSPSSSGQAGPVASSTTAPTLPVTGTPTGIFLVSGAAAVLVGGTALVIAGRRKRRAQG
jgi:LPXTG-motif cell wall-anchored protein